MDIFLVFTWKVMFDMEDLCKLLAYPMKIRIVSEITRKSLT